MENIHQLSERQLAFLKFRVSLWKAPLSEYQLAVLKELKLIAS